MTTQQQLLWKKLEQFSFDEPGTTFTFTHRLARENGWSLAYAVRVLQEYRKFLFLCCITDSGVTPSDPVDQAWHLHLTYTRSYWTDLCRHTLEREIHHNPTKGGSEEGDKFNSFYTTTHDLYRNTFGTEPPPDIWHNHHTRFSDVHFERVNRGWYWIIRKPSMTWKRSLSLAAICGVALLSIQATFDFSLIIILGMMALMAVLIYRNRGTGGGGGGGCTAASCAGALGHDSSHSNDSSSGCSGCSSSGCSGCGGGD